MDLKRNCRLLFIGDSITDCGRRYAAGADISGNALGNGYVSLIAATLTASHPEYAVDVMNAGVSGNTIRDLEDRWERDVLALHPNQLSVMIGINDVWQQIDGMWGAGTPISVDEFADTLDRLITRVLPTLEGLVLLTPYYLSPDKTDPMRKLMDEFGRAVLSLATSHRAVGVDTQAAFDKIMREVPPEKLAQDRVHVGLVGHMVLTQAFLKGIGYS